MLEISRSLRRKSRLVSEEHQVYRCVNLRTKRFDMGYQAVRNLHSEPMRVSAHLPEVTPDMRPMYTENRGTSTRRQRIDDRARSRRDVIQPVSIVGLRGGIGLTVLAAIFLCVLTFSLWSHTRVTGAQKTIDQLNTQVIRSAERLESAQLDFEGSLASIDVAYNARNLGLVSSKSVEAIILYAPEEAHFSPADTEPVLPRDTLATILGY